MPESANSQLLELELDFDRDGAVVVRGAFDASGMADALWGHLERRYRKARGDQSTWTPGGLGKGLTSFGKKSGVFAAVGSPRVSDALTSVLGPIWHERERWGAPLVTFGTPGAPWDVTRNNWHMDMPAAAPVYAARMFAFLAPVRPRGGGTLLLAGSHRLAEKHPGMSSSDFRKLLAGKSEWFADLWGGGGDDRVQRFMVEGTSVDGIDVRVVELTGEPGDVVVWHQSLLHAISPNCLIQPRMMLTHTAYRGPARVRQAHGTA